MSGPPRFKRVVFFHPDLGIGGAERLVVDAAVGLQNRGYHVTIFTSYCDPQHCFDEARDGTLDVRVRGASIVPSSIFSRFSILCAILRQLHLMLQIFVSGELNALKPDAFFVDQLSAGLPALRYLCPKTRILFYCHFPDLLLAQGRGKWWKRAYRIPFDWLEEWSMSFADAVAVNSAFTKAMVAKVWPALAAGKDLKVVHPCVDIREKKTFDGGDEGLIWHDTNIILSINRFEAKKDVGLAIRAFAGLGKHGRDGVRLVIAGGYDHRVAENFLYHKELEKLAEGLGLKAATCRNVITALSVPDDVSLVFLLSVPSNVKDALLKAARLLVYTPSNEHFGIVPLEAMLVGTPVLAANTGGPLETVVDGKTGWLCPPGDVKDWTAVMDRVLHKIPAAELKKMSRASQQRVQKEFSDVKMAEKIDGIVEGMSKLPRRASSGLVIALVALSILSTVVFGILARLLMARRIGG
ncbi:MAG: Alpha-1,3-mannosyltransferase-like protein [Claussenomyces sp. TS43310]|nr:MAG: Alpha-1,3-mannosyltransferase-like protein [Claussenomyces sp. TS43310]